MSDAAVAAIAATQLGLITQEQARLGLTTAQLRWRVEKGRLDRLHGGVLRVAGSPPSWEQDLLVECFAHDAAASHRAAAQLWGFPGPWSDRLEITVPARSPRCPSRAVRVHRSTIPFELLTAVGPIPVTSRGRTLIDLSAVVSEQRLARVTEQALVLRQVQFEELVQALAKMARRGRRRVTVVRQMLLSAADVGAAESGGEVKLLRWLVAAGLPFPVQQHWLVANGRRYRLDLAYPDLQVAVEYDGRGHDESPLRAMADRRRHADLATAGWLVLAFDRSAARSQVVALVRAALKRRSPAALSTFGGWTS